MSERSKPASLVRNTLAQSAGSFSGYIFSFLSAPIVLDGLGLRNFGIWALTGALAQYGALLDLGVGVSLARYVAVHEDDRRLCGQYMAIGWLSVVVIALGLTALSVFGAAPLAHTLHGISVADMRVVLYSSVVLLCSSMLTGVIGAYAIGRRRMVAPNLGLGIGSAINFAASIGSIELGAGLPGYALANAGAGILGVFVVAGLVVGSEGALPLSLPERHRARGFLAFSVNAQLVRITNLVNYQTDKIVIAFSVGPSAAGAYELANRVAIAIRTVGIYVTSAVNIELAALYTQFGIERVRARYARLNEVTAAVSFPPVLVTMATAPLLLAAWLAHAPPNSTPVLVALSGAYLLPVSTGVSYAVAAAAGQPGVVAKASVGASVANIVLTAALAPLFGIWGVLTGTVVALSAGAIVQMVLVHRRFDLPTASYLGAIAPALRTYLLLAAPVAALSYAHLVHTRAGEAALFVVLSIAYLAACGAWAVRSNRLPPAITRRFTRVRWLRPRARPESSVTEPDTPSPGQPTEPGAPTPHAPSEPVRNA
jgi:O-antigen/teichoic acid export membrane protein